MEYNDVFIAYGVTIAGLIVWGIVAYVIERRKENGNV